MRRYIPVFAGTSTEDEAIIIYQEQEDDLLIRPFSETPKEVHCREEFHIRINGGELQALGPDPMIEMRMEDLHHRMNVRVVSPQWTGEANGSRMELMEAEKI